MNEVTDLSLFIVCFQNNSPLNDFHLGVENRNTLIAKGTNFRSNLMMCKITLLASITPTFMCFYFICDFYASPNFFFITIDTIVGFLFPHVIYRIKNNANVQHSWHTVITHLPSKRDQKLLLQVSLLLRNCQWHFLSQIK